MATVDKTFKVKNGVEVPLGAAATPAVSFAGDLNTGIYSPGADQVGIATAGTARVVVNAAGEVLVATTSTTSDAAGVPAVLQVAGIGNADSRQSLYRFSNDTTPPALNFGHSRGAAVGSFTVVADADFLGHINFEGSDGSQMRRAARISAAVDGSPSSADMPGRLTFWTSPDGSATVTERMRIDNAGQITTGLGSATAPVLSFFGDTNTGIYSPGADQVGIATAGTAAVIIDASQRVGIGMAPTVPLTIYAASNANILTQGDGNTAITANRRSTDANPPLLNLRKGRGTVASPSIVAANDTVGRIAFQGYDGATDQILAQIEGAVDGTPAAGDMPGRLIFSTAADGAATVTERMRIDNVGNVSIATGTLTVSAGTISATGLAGSLLSSATPATNGVAAAGTSAIPSRQDHVHGTDTTRAPLASPTFTGTVTAATLDLTTAATATAATSYFVETGSDGVVRPKTLANVKTEVVTTAAVNAAAATTVGTVTSGVWNAGAVTSSGVVTGTNLALTTGSIYRSVDTGVLNIYGGTDTLGANVELYGSTHATLASRAYYDASLHTFRSAAAATWVTIDATGIAPTVTADTATTASHYFVETATDGYIRPKTLANVRTEIVTTAAVNAAAATTVGTVTSGVWNAGAVTSSGSLTSSSGTPLIGSNAGFQYMRFGTDHVAFSKKPSTTYAYYFRSSTSGLDDTGLNNMVEFYNDRLVFYTNNSERGRFVDAGLSVTGTIVATSTVSGSGLAGSLLSSATPLANGTATAGTSAIPSRQDHVHPASAVTPDYSTAFMLMGA